MVLPVLYEVGGERIGNRENENSQNSHDHPFFACHGKRDRAPLSRAARSRLPTMFLLRVSWTEQTALKAHRVWHTEQPKAIIERAAVALAALLFAKLIPDGQMRVTREGDRADYWLPRMQCALEVSGTEHSRELPRRHREKVAQMLSNPLGWNGYVVVCCFAAQQRLIRWSYHEQEAKGEKSSES